MRYKNQMVNVVAIVLGVVTFAGMSYTEHFPQAARAESVGFDALAHDLFSGVHLACADDKQTVKVAAR